MFSADTRRYLGAFTFEPGREETYMSGTIRVLRGCTARAAALSLALGFVGANAGTAAANSADGTPFDAHGSVEQVYVTGLSSGEQMNLVNGDGAVVQTAAADSLGGLIFRNVDPGDGYRVEDAAGGPESDPITVLGQGSAPPDPSIYSQAIPSSGYGYLTTRDGIKLAIDVHPPTDLKNQAPSVPGVSAPALPQTNAPTPTLIEYSGYGYADPAGPQNGIAILANAMGFTVVDVNMRGTGCSGGAFDFFEPLQSLDGYDVVETIAHQPWVLHHKVGMMGISYGGISQLFTAQTDPPDLAAISPLSVIDQTQTTLYPGGILNTGFAVAWAQERIHDALPASPNGGQSWAYKQIQSGDTTCKDDQVLHGEAVDLMAKIRANDHYVPSVADPLAPTTFVHKIRVPVYMACQWTDEQTGGHCADLAEHFSGTTRKWFTFTNGDHIDSLDPDTYNRWCDFLSIYVAKLPPAALCAPSHGAAPVIYNAAMGLPENETLPPDPIQAMPTVGLARRMFEKLPSIRILFDNGAGSQNPASQTPYYPDPGFEQSWSKFPIPGTTARAWYLAPGGALGDAKPTTGGADSFLWNPNARPLNDFSGGTDGSDLWGDAPTYHWLQPPAGSAVSYLTAPLAANATVIGAGFVKLWVRSPTPNVDLQATITEVRPDGKETFVQGGWLRADERKLDSVKSSYLEPVLSLRAKDVQAMPDDRYVPLEIPLYYEGHAYRAGSRIRVIITAPNGDQPIWAFSETEPAAPSDVSIAYSHAMPSSLVLPVVPGVSVPTALPPCPGLRGEPCRSYQAITNAPATP